MYLWYFGPHISFNLAGEKNRYKCHAYHRALTQSCPLVSCLLMREGAMLAFPVLSRAHCISLAEESCYKASWLQTTPAYAGATQLLRYGVLLHRGPYEDLAPTLAVGTEQGEG